MTEDLPAADAGAEMHALGRELFPIMRSLAGPGIRTTLDRLEVVAGPMQRHRFATGERVFDWTVPPEWTVREAWIRGPDGSVVVDMADHNLHIVSHSIPVHARVGREELDPHLHSLPDQPDAIPYLTTYYKESWGFCLTDHQRRALGPGTYEVMIDADLAPGRLELGEIVLEGEGPGEVLWSTYCCHPSMANNELSGPLVLAFLVRHLRGRGRPRLTHRFLFCPETIGAIAYLSRLGERLRDRLVAGYVATCVGDPGDFTYKRSRRGDTLADRAAEHALRHLGAAHETLDFVPIGSDERQYCSPGFDLPVGSLMRSMYSKFPEYHTSLDDFELVTPAALGESLAVYARIAATLEAAETFVNTAPHGEPNLGSRGLYPQTGGTGALFQPGEARDTMMLLNWCDGTRDLVEVAERADRPVWMLAPVAATLREHGLLVPARR